MQPWQDDNALMFKLSHIEEPAGFLGKGVLGEGPYRYTATPYYLLYKIFGYNTYIFFGTAVLFYFLATLAIYYLFKTLFNQKVGIVASLLFAVNYPSSDSFIRLFNSISSSLGVIVVSLLFICYWNFFKTKKIVWYFLSLISFLLAVDLTYVRFHYLISLVIVFEILFLLNSIRVKSLANLLLRVLPYLAIFYWFYVLNGDSRGINGLENLNQIFKGKIENLLTFFSGVGYMVSADKVYPVASFFISKFSLNPYYLTLMFNIFFLIIFNLGFYFFAKEKKKVKLVPVVLLMSSVTLLFIRYIFIKASLQTYSLLYISFIGALIILGICITLFLYKGLKKRILIFLSFWMTINIVSYGLYDPTVFNSITNTRYLVHSYIAFIGFIAWLAVGKSKVKIKDISLLIIFVWGVFNLFNNVQNQHDILINRSNQISSFYKSLKKDIANLPLGTVLYFDVQKNSKAEARFLDTINAAQMPDTTSIAWRYGVDRYDIKMATNFTNLQAFLEHNVPLSQVHTFWYSEQGLLDTSQKFRGLMKSKNKYILGTTPQSVEYQEKDLILNLDKPLESIVPMSLTLSIKARPDTAKLTFPLGDKNSSEIYHNSELRNLALEYKDYRNKSLKNIIVSSQWLGNVKENLIDTDVRTLWQPNRVVWSKDKASIVLELNQEEEINRLVWVNGYADNTPTKFSVLASKNGNDWQVVSNISQNLKLDPVQPRIIEFKPIVAKFIKMQIDDTINSDAPALSEIWIVSSAYSKLDIKEAELFLENPFAYVKSPEDLINEGKVKVSWLGDKEQSWQAGNNSYFVVNYDNQTQEHKVVIPAGGTKITKIKLSQIYPGRISILDAWVNYSNSWYSINK